MPTKDEQHLGAAESATGPTPHEMQREERAKTGEYLCEVCQTKFEFKSGPNLECPKCHNVVTDKLTPIFTPEDPAKDELLSRDEFTEG